LRFGRITLKQAVVFACMTLGADWRCSIRFRGRLIRSALVDPRFYLCRDGGAPIVRHAVRVGSCLPAAAHALGSLGNAFQEFEFPRQLHEFFR
jgi:hypothetical protein